MAKNGDELETMLSYVKVNRYYNPDVIRRPSCFDGLDQECVNRCLLSLEWTLSSTSLNTSEVRVVVCLIVYSRLTHLEMQNLTGIKQSAVSRAVKSLKEKHIVQSRIGKKYEVGRPYQLVELVCPLDSIFEGVTGAMYEHLSNLRYVVECKSKERHESREG